jgi:hypothetical protein
LVLIIIVYSLSSTKLEIRAKQFLPGSEGVGGKRRGGGKGVEMTQILYAHMNKRNKKKERKKGNGKKNLCASVSTVS